MKKLHLNIALSITMIHFLSVGYASNLDNQDDQRETYQRRRELNDQISSSNSKSVRSEAIPPFSTSIREGAEALLSLDRFMMPPSTSLEEGRESDLSRYPSSSSFPISNYDDPLWNNTLENTWNIMYRHVENHLKNNNLKGAIECLNVFITLPGINEIQIAEALNVMGIVKSKSGDHQGAIPDFNKVLSVSGIRNKIKAQALVARSKAQGQLGQHDKAIEDLGKAYELKEYLSPSILSDIEARLNCLYY